ncbi:hypothetical protein [Luoshenia tenuis]|jgi:hypothetical protein|uniref:hypothetical protein n=1 Tax=Luoshenia tenuis TaxID=2763654 RepID=UPI003D9340F5
MKKVVTLALIVALAAFSTAGCTFAPAKQAAATVSASATATVVPAKATAAPSKAAATAKPATASSANKGTTGSVLSPSAQFNAIAEKYYFKITDVSDPDLYQLTLPISSAGYTSRRDLAVDALLQVMRLFGDVIQLDQVPCQGLIISINLDGRDIAVVSVYTAVDLGMLGTNEPMMLDTNYSDAFKSVYQQYFAEIDYKTLTK